MIEKSFPKPESVGSAGLPRGFEARNDAFHVFQGCLESTALYTLLKS